MTKKLPFNQLCPICKSKNIRYWGSVSDIGHPEIKHNISKCSDCTHVFINPLPSKEYLKEAYRTSNSSVYSNNGFFESRSSGPFSEGDKWVWKHASESVILGSLIDIGSANLNLLKQIAKLGWQLTLVEPAPHAERMGELLQCNVYRCSFEDCNFQNKFDIISAIDVLEHIHSPIDFLKRTKSILSDDGIALFRFPNSNSLRCMLARENWNMIRPLGHLHYFSPRSFQTACEITNLKIVTLRSHDLACYRSLTVRGKRIRGMRFFAPLLKVLDRALFGDQLLVKVTHA